MKLIYPDKFEVKHILPHKAGIKSVWLPNGDELWEKVIEALKLSGPCECNDRTSKNQCSVHFKDGKKI